MATLGQFGQIMLRGSSRIGEAVNTAVKACCAGAHEFVVEGTPVDTGQARSNWIVTLGNPTNRTRPPYVPGNKLGRRERHNLNASVIVGLSTISGRQPGQTVYIQNNLDYIQALNSGQRSKQAGPRFVQNAVVAGIRALNKLKLTLS